MVDLYKAKNDALARLEENSLEQFEEELQARIKGAFARFKQIEQQHLEQVENLGDGILIQKKAETDQAFADASRRVSILETKIGDLEKRHKNSEIITRLKLIIFATAVAALTTLIILLASAIQVGVNRTELAELRSDYQILEAHMALLRDATRIGAHIRFENGRYVFHLPDGAEFKPHTSVRGLENFNRNAWYISKGG